MRWWSFQQWDKGHFGTFQDDTLHSGSEASNSGGRVFHTRIMRCSFHMRTKHISTHKGRAWGGVRIVIMNYMMWWAVVWISFSLLMLNSFFTCVSRLGRFIWLWINEVWWRKIRSESWLSDQLWCVFAVRSLRNALTDVKIQIKSVESSLTRISRRRRRSLFAFENIYKIQLE